MKSNRPELALLRGKRSPANLEQWIEAFGEGDRDRGERYAAAAAALLGTSQEDDAFVSYMGALSPNTRRAYAYSITEFFEWLAAVHGHIVPPHNVTSQDAQGYVEWLANRDFTLELAKLKDGDAQERLVLYEIVQGLGSGPARLQEIVERVPSYLRTQHPGTKGGEIDRAWLSHELGRMVLHQVLTRSPSIEELRRDNPQIGITEHLVDIPKKGGGLTAVSYEEVYNYSVPVGRPVSRATAVLRLSALSSFWQALSLPDRQDTEPLIKYDVFAPVKKRVSRGLSAERRLGAQKQNQLTPEIVQALLVATDGTSLSERRDAALLWFLVLSGVRINEALQMRRSDPPRAEENRYPGWFELTSDPPTFVIIRKGGKRQRLPYPSYALRALVAFQAALEDAAAPRAAQSERKGQPGYIAPDSARWRYRELADQPDAPLFPSLEFWGANSTHRFVEHRPNAAGRPGARYQRAMTQQGAEKLLQRIAERAQLSEADQKKVHPHALRHFAGTAMAEQGKPIREIQHILGHETMLTTEGYLKSVTSMDALSGQAEVLSYIARAAPAQPAQEAPPEEVVSAHGTSVEEAPEPEAEPPSPVEEAEVVAAVEPGGSENLLAEPPSPEPVAVTVHERGRGKEPIVELSTEQPPDAPSPALEIDDGMSWGSPRGVYEALAEGQDQEEVHFTRVMRRGTAKGHKKAATVTTKTTGGKQYELIQADTWLRDHYDPWPLNYGIGADSLLPWFAKGSPSKNGVVTASIPTPEGGRRTVKIEPLPVLAPDQVYPETDDPRALFTRLEELYERWVTEAPSKTYGLERWFAFFAWRTANLEKETDKNFNWVPFDGVAKLGDDVRAHDDEWLAEWFEQNAHTYRATVRAFEDIQRPRGRSYDDLEWADFKESFQEASFEGVGAQDIPEWFADADPIRAIYDRDPKEFDELVDWLANITGKKLTKERDESRDIQEEYSADKRDENMQQAIITLGYYYDWVDELDAARRSGDFTTANDAKETVSLAASQLTELGIGDPTQSDLPRSRDERIAKLVAQAFPEKATELTNPNVFAGAEVFDPGLMHIDTRTKTITHTPQYRRLFAERYDGRDSECVMRRAVRAMWETVQRSGRVAEKGRAQASQYSLLYSVMLSYIAWIVPCPKDMEEAMRTTHAPERGRKEYLLSFNRALKLSVLGEEEPTDIMEVLMETGLDKQGAEAALDTLLFQHAFSAEQEVPGIDVEEAQFREAFGSMLVFQPTSRGAIISEAGESPEEGERLMSIPEELIPNSGQRIYFTPNAQRVARNFVANAKRVLPSPLKMIAAMTVLAR